MKELCKQAPASQSPSTPHPSTPSTFSPGNTSTPVKPVKQPLTTRQLATSTPIKSKTQKCHSNNPKQSLPNWKRRGSKDKKTPTTTRKTKHLVKTNKSYLDDDSPKPLKNESDRKSSFSSLKKVEVKIKDPSSRRIQKTPFKRGQETPSKRGHETPSNRSQDTSLKKNQDTPSKRSQEAKEKAWEAFLINSSLPVWEPPKEMELIQKTPEMALTPTAWGV